MIQKEIAKPKSITKKSSKAWKNGGAQFFPVVTGVQTPYVGQDDSISITAKSLVQSLTQSRSNTPVPSQPTKNKNKQKMLRSLGDVKDPFPDETAKKLDNRLPQTFLYLPVIETRRERQQSRQHMKEISKNLHFTNDVVALHCSHELDYNKDELSKIVYKGKRKERTKMIEVGCRGTPLKHMPRPLNARGSILAPKPSAFHKIDKDMKHEMEDILCSVAKTTGRPYGVSVFKIDKPDAPKSAECKSEWDEYVLSLLSKSTAKWLTSEFSSGTQHVRLTGFLKERYKENKRDDTVELEKGKVEITVKRNSKAGVELEKILTETNFDVHFSPSFTLPSGVGDKKLITDNAFQQEMMAGAFPVKGRRVPRKSIVLNTNSKVTFEKRLQANYPEDPQKWSHGRRNSKVAKITGSKIIKGLQRWNELPSLLQDESYIPSFKSFDDQSVAFGKDELLSIHQAKENNNVLRIGEEWRSKWLLEKRWQNVSTTELAQGMRDIHDHVRLAAVAACCKAAEVRQRKKAEQSFGPSLHDKEMLDVEKMKKELEPELLECVTKLLEDGCKQVRLTAAVTLCSMSVEESKAVEILQETVQNGSAIERWIATQCLASSGCSSDSIISELLSQTTSGNDILRQEQAAKLLLKLSHQTSLVHAIVAEQLNSSSCQDRLIACRLLPRLHGTLNKDVAQKLSHIMWNDWQRNVRTAAAQALGRTGNGKLVHDALLKRLSDDNERMKVDALRKLANLGIMTAHLLPAFLSCFTSEFVSVRLDAAVAAGVINTPDDDIIAALVKSANEDHSWKVKAHAIKALGIIKKVTHDVVDMLVWSMRYGKLAAVRAEACNAVAELGLNESRVLRVLQDRLVVETEEVVRSEARRALQSFNVEFTGDVEMMDTIRSEVKRLCNKNNVVSSILAKDKQEDYEKDYQRMLAIDDVSQRCTQTPHDEVKSSADSWRGWDPILAGFRARSVMSEPSTPIMFKMERSLLQMDLNSATSEGSLGSREDLESEYTDSGRSDVTAGEVMTSPLENL